MKRGREGKKLWPGLALCMTSWLSPPSFWLPHLFIERNGFIKNSWTDLEVIRVYHKPDDLRLIPVEETADS